ncbi:MAG: SH3 domain-containing protein [Anaerolineae bacterium]|nr:SH3 domain-containing protein [Anaerolineae bacterium]
MRSITRVGLFICLAIVVITSSAQYWSPTSISMAEGVIGSVPAAELFEGEGDPAVSYTFEGQAGQTIIFHAAGSLFSDEQYADRVDRPDARISSILQPLLEVYAPDGSLLVRAEADDEILHARADAVTLPQTGQYRVVVSGLNDTFGRFALAVAPADVENNRKRIAIDDAWVGIAAADNRSATDLWSFEGQAGQSIYVSTSAVRQIESTVLSTGLFIELQSPNGRSITNSYDLGPITLPEDGTYVIGVRRFGDQGDNSLYTLNVVERVARHLDGRIIYFETLNGAFPADENNEWVFESEAGDKAILNLRLTEGNTNLAYVVLDENDNQIASRSLRGASSNNDLDYFEIPSSGDYRIIVTGGRGMPAEYEITLTRAEDNDVRSLAFGQVIAEVFLKEDTHQWSFDAAAGEIIRIDATGYRSPKLYTPTGEDYSTLSGVFSSDLLGRNLQLSEAGTYTLELSGSRGQPYDAYILALSRIEVDMPDLREIAMGQVAMGTISANDPIDFQVNLPSGNVNIQFLDQGSGSPEVQILDENNTIVDGSRANSTSGFVTSNYPEGFRIDEPGNYRLRLLTEYDQDFTYFFGLYDDTETPLSFWHEIQQDTTMAVGESIFLAGKRQYYDEDPQPNIITFDGEAGQSVRIKATNINYELPEMVIKILDPDGNFMAESYSENYSTVNELLVNLTQTGTYTLEITAVTYPEFQLDLTNAEDDTRLGLLNPLVNYHYQSSQQYTQNNLNEWTFYGNAGDIVNIRLHMQTSLQQPSDPLVELYAPDGRFLVENDDFDDLNSFIASYELPDDGLYTVVARDYNGAVYNYDLYLIEGEINPLLDEANEIEACTMIMRQAYEILANTCMANTNGNEACLVNPEVSTDTTSSYNFSSAGDILPLEDVVSLVSQPLDEANETYGLTYMNIPVKTINGGTVDVRAVLVGDAALQNPSVDASLVIADDSEDEETEPVVITANVSVPGGTNINVRSGPGTNFGVSSVLTSGTTYTAIGRNADSSWLQIQFEDGSLGWAFSDLLTVEDDIDSLQITNTSSTAAPTQNTSGGVSLYFLSASGDSNCKRGPESGLMLYAPTNDDNYAQIRINGTDIEFAGILFLQAEAGNAMRIYSVEGGTARVRVNNADTYIYGSSSLVVPLNNELNAVGAPGSAESYNYRAVQALPIRYIRQ